MDKQPGGTSLMTHSTEVIIVSFLKVEVSKQCYFRQWLGCLTLEIISAALPIEDIQLEN